MLLLRQAGRAATSTTSAMLLLRGLAGHDATLPRWPCCYSASSAMLQLLLAGHAATLPRWPWARL